MSPADDVAPVLHAREVRPGDHVRLVEQDPAQGRVPGEDRRQQRTTAAGDVDHGGEPPKS